MPKSVSISECGVRLLRALSLAALLPAAAFAADAMPAMKRAALPELGTSAVFAPDGTLYAVAKQGEHVVLYRSADEGATWSIPTIVNALPEALSADGENRPKLAFAADGALLVSWTRPLSRPFSGEIRLARAGEGGQFSAPITVHTDRSEITHRFESMVVAGDGRVVVVWIDKRDLEAAGGAKNAYRGAAVYAATSRDGGRSFLPEEKVADHSCECCRIAVALDRDGAPLLMWRHVFEPNERDHALVKLDAAKGFSVVPQRATFDRWKVDGCPHHGPSLVVDGDGVRHAVWFNQRDGEGHVFYGRLSADGSPPQGQRVIGGTLAAHADLVVAGRRVAIVWKEFDGSVTRLRAELSEDGGETFRTLELAAAAGANDQPRALRRGDRLFAFWRSEREGLRIFPID